MTLTPPTSTNPSPNNQSKNHLDNFSYPPLSAFQPGIDTYNKRQRALNLLSEGQLIAKVAALIGFTIDNTYKLAQRARKAGALVKEPFFSPAIYSKGPNFDEYLKKSNWTKLSPTKRTPSPNIATPHHFPVYYHIRNSYRPLGVSIARRNWQALKIETESLTAIWGTKTLTIWVKMFKKGSPADKIWDGINQAAEYASLEGQKGARLAYNRLDKRIEWVLTTKPISDYLAATLGLKDGPQVIAKARWILDITHPENVEVNKELGQPDEAATKAIKLLDYYLDEDKFLAHIKLKEEEFRASTELTRSAIIDLQEGLRLSLQRMNIIEAELKAKR